MGDCRQRAMLGRSDSSAEMATLLKPSMPSNRIRVGSSEEKNRLSCSYFNRSEPRSMRPGRFYIHTHTHTHARTAAVGPHRLLLSGCFAASSLRRFVAPAHSSSPS